MRNNELMPYVRGQAKARPQDRQMVRRARRTYEDAHDSAFRASAGMALAAHIMEETAGLHQHRESLAGQDVGLNMLLLDIELEAVRGARTIQRRFASDFGF